METNNFQKKKILLLSAVVKSRKAGGLKRLVEDQGITEWRPNQTPHFCLWQCLDLVHTANFNKISFDTKKASDLNNRWVLARKKTKQTRLSNSWAAATKPNIALSPVAMFTFLSGITDSEIKTTNIGPIEKIDGPSSLTWDLRRPRIIIEHKGDRCQAVWREYKNGSKRSWHEPHVPSDAGGRNEKSKGGN